MALVLSLGPTGTGVAAQLLLGIKECLAHHAPDEVTEATNWVCAEVGETKDPFVSSAALRTLERSEW